MISLSSLLFGLLSGFVGTVAMTVGQYLEMWFITHRTASFTPAIIVSNILKIDFTRLSERAKAVLNNAAHFGYGTFLGILLPLLSTAFENLLALFAVYAGLVWIQGLIVVPLFTDIEPFWKWERRWIVIDFIHHLVLASASFVFYINEVT